MTHDVIVGMQDDERMFVECSCGWLWKAQMTGPEPFHVILDRGQQHLDSVVDAKINALHGGMNEPESVEWSRFYDGSIMWREFDPPHIDRTVGCPFCGAAVFDTEIHVRWHEAQA